MPDIRTPTYDWAVRHSKIRNEYIREGLAEFFGTFLLLFFVIGSGLQALLQKDSFAIPVFGSVFGLMVCIIIFGGISGAHINPAVSLGLAVAGHLNWIKLPIYASCQMLGGFLGSLLSYGIYKAHLENYVSGGNSKITVPEYDRTHDGIIVMHFSSTPEGTDLGVGILTEIIVTAVLLMTVMAVIDKGNMKIPSFFLPFTLALTVASIAMAHGIVTGGMLNPARDFAPRVAAWALGFESEHCFTNLNFKNERQQWWVVGLIGPLVGAVAGVLLYTFLVGAHLTNGDSEEMNNNQIEPNDGKIDNADWRNGTRFIPRTGAPQQGSAISFSPTSQPSFNGHINQGYAPQEERVPSPPRMY